MPVELVYIIMTNFAFFVVAWALCLYLKDMSKIDIIWSISFVLLAGLSITSLSMEKLLIFILILIWALRLSLYLLIRNRHMGEDKRYRKMKENWKGSFAINSLLRVFLVQALLSSIVGIPLYSLSELRLDFDTVSIFFLFSATVGIIYEGFADYQKYQFKRNIQNLGKVCDQGLWKYSRHPNYFGELLFWWSLTMVIFLGTNQFFVFIGPLFLNILLLKVSGVPMLEQFYHGNAAYDAYKKTTNRLIPWRKNA
jgi:steroid 5-alpha reductase family enzyme